MRWKDGLRLILLHFLFLVKIHYTLIFIRHILPTIAGENAYYPENYVFSDAKEAELNRKRYNESFAMYREFEHRSQEYDWMLDIRIVASDRRMGYLMQVIGYLLNSFSSRKTVPQVSICNTANHVFEELHPFQNVLPIHNINSSRIFSNQLSARISKETSDYWQCLNISTKARYILLLEDDALVVPEFPNLMESILYQLDHRPDIDYVKLYHPKSLRKLPSIPMAISLSLAVVSVFQLVVFRRFIPLLLVVSSIVLYMDIRSYSSQFMSDLRFAVSGSAYMSMPESCCTPAVIFRSSSVGKMVEDLSSVRSFDGKAKDHILDESSFVGRQTDSDLVVHIGSFSAVRGRKVKLAIRS